MVRAAQSTDTEEKHLRCNDSMHMNECAGWHRCSTSRPDECLPAIALVDQLHAVTPQAPALLLLLLL
jgi:hypothetical protein